MTDTLTVELEDRSYPIEFLAAAKDLPKALLATLPSEAPYAVIADKAPWASLSDSSLSTAPSHILEAGESAKSTASFEAACEFLAERKVARDWTLLAVGGGVIGDLAGFVAASYLRGINFIQVPTTLLAMVDSSVGGKTGINLRAGKNLVGAFWQPKAVFISMDFLKTLPHEEFAAGMAEVIKYGMLYDLELFETLETLPEPLTWDHPKLPAVVRRCCEIKAEIVKADEKETAASGGRALLNLGHTFAHAIENVAGYGSYLHGEAVAIGLLMAGKLSQRLRDKGKAAYQVSLDDISRVDALLRRNRLPTNLSDPLHRDKQQVQAEKLACDSLLEAMRRDKKVRSGQLRLVAMESLGKAVTVDDVPEAMIRQLWAEAGAI